MDFGLFTRSGAGDARSNLGSLRGLVAAGPQPSPKGIHDRLESLGAQA